MLDKTRAVEPELLILVATGLEADYGAEIILWLVNVPVSFEKTFSKLRCYQGFVNLVLCLHREEASWHYVAGWTAVHCRGEGLTFDFLHLQHGSSPDAYVVNLCLARETFVMCFVVP